MLVPPGTSEGVCWAHVKNTYQEPAQSRLRHSSHLSDWDLVLSEILELKLPIRTTSCDVGQGQINEDTDLSPISQGENRNLQSTSLKFVTITIPQHPQAHSRHWTWRDLKMQSSDAHLWKHNLTLLGAFRDALSAVGPELRANPSPEQSEA